MDAECELTFPAPAPVINRALSPIRLYSMKLIYLLTFVGLGISAWPQMVHRAKPWDPLYGVAYSFWLAYGLLMILGVRFPVRMLPLMLLQFVYKLTWVIGVGYPLWSAGHMSPAASGLLEICGVGVIVDLLVIPWPYVFANYVKAVFSPKAKDESPAR